MKEKTITYIAVCLLSALAVFNTPVTFICIDQIYKMRNVIDGLSSRFDANYSKDKIRYKSRDYLAGYYDAIADRDNINIFKGFYKSKRAESLIFDFFER